MGRNAGLAAQKNDPGRSVHYTAAQLEWSGPTTSVRPILFAVFWFVQTQHRQMPTVYVCVWMMAIPSSQGGRFLLFCGGMLGEHYFTFVLCRLLVLFVLLVRDGVPAAGSSRLK